LGKDAPVHFRERFGLGASKALEVGLSDNVSQNLILRVGILTVSDRSSAGTRPDASGPALEGLIATRGWKVVRRRTVPDEIAAIKKVLLSWAGSGDLDLILTTGGTGFSPRDVTPEATQAVIERAAPGLAEAMRHASLRVTPHGMLSRSVSGIRGRCLIVNLPGSPKAATENLDVIIPVLPHAVQLLREDPRSEAGHQAS
jgi:molybdopterin adenylyltransferase